MEVTTPTATQITSVTYSEDLLVIEWADGEKRSSKTGLTTEFSDVDVDLISRAPIPTLMACTAALMC